MKVYYCLDCKKVHVTDPEDFTSCPDCGGEVALINLTPREWDEMSGEEQYRIRKYLDKQGRALKTPKRGKGIVKKALSVLACIILLVLMGAGMLLVIHQEYLLGVVFIAVSVVIAALLAISTLLKRKQKDRP